MAKRYCERWEKTNIATGEVTRISCRSWNCPRCRPDMEAQLSRKIILARPNYFLTISWKEPPDKAAWQQFVRSARKQGEFDACVFSTPGHLHAIIRSTWHPGMSAVSKYFPCCQVDIKEYTPAQVKYCVSHLGRPGARHRASRAFFTKERKVENASQEPKKENAQAGLQNIETHLGTIALHLGTIAKALQRRYDP